MSFVCGKGKGTNLRYIGHTCPPGNALQPAKPPLASGGQKTHHRRPKLVLVTARKGAPCLLSQALGTFHPGDPSLLQCRFQVSAKSGRPDGTW